MADTSKINIVKNYIFEEINKGRLSSGQRLPSCRDTAVVLGVNKITVNRAYNELEKEHIVYSIPRGGFYLIESEPVYEFKTEVVDFLNVKPDEKLLPYREFTHSLDRAVDIYKKSLFEYDSSAGLLSLRETLRNEFQRDCVYTSEDRIIITNGAQQAISLIFQCLYQNSNKKLLVEVPTYGLALKLAEYFEIETVGIMRDAEGYDLKELEKMFRKGDISAFYIVPGHQNPTGYSLTEKYKKRIAELSNKYGVIIIEDDYLADLASGKGCLPIHYYDVSKQTIYIRSFSKTFIPGIRLGAAVIPEQMMNGILQLKYMSDLNTSRLNQAALDIFIKTGMYEKHIKKVKKSYEAKLKKAAEIFNDLYMADINWYVPEHGIFIWLEMPGCINADELSGRMKKKGILIKNASDSFLNGFKNDDREYIRLCISGVDIKNIGSISMIVKEIISMIPSKDKLE